MCDFPHRLSKGYPVNIPEQGYGYFYGNVNELGDASRDPGKSSLFFLTVQWTLESDCPAIRFNDWESSIIFVLSGALPTTRENPVA